MVDGPGASWARLIRLLAVGARDQAALAHHPLIGGQFEEAVVDGLLLATGHPYRDQLARPPAARPVPGAIRAAPRAIRIAVDALQAEPGRPWTAARLADVAGISLRSLQEGFHRHVGSPPMAYLRGVRLARAHEALTHADPDRTTVAAIAYRWGFAHLGRFAAVYRTRYGVMPSVTLRSRS
jgi:transcriptional regulator GlxA family with amidase domain